MGFASIYIDAVSKANFPPESQYQSLWQEWLWEMDCNAMIDESCGDMNPMHILGILLALLESMKGEVSTTDDKLEDFLPEIPLVHLHKKPISKYSLRELTDQVFLRLCAIC
jgi:hypothetical protein